MQSAGITEEDEPMLRKTMIALFTFASVAMLIPDAASARGGGGHGGGGFGGGGGFPGGGGLGGGGGLPRGGEGVGGASAAAEWVWVAADSAPLPLAVVSGRPHCRQPDFAAAPLRRTASAAPVSTMDSVITGFRLPEQRSVSGWATGSMDPTAMTMTTIPITQAMTIITATAAATLSGEACGRRMAGESGP